jgi:outer membrane cobalamin receptor
VTITATRSSRTFKNLPTRVEFIAGEELDEKANMKPGDIRMVLNESTGVQVQTTSAISGNASIRIQGLDGRYTQILKDGFPLYGGFSGGLGLLQTPPLDLKQVEIIKGASSTLYGGDAMAGLVNLVSKTPKEKGEGNIFLNATLAGGLDIHGYYGRRAKKTGITFFAARNSNSAYDPSLTGFSAIPRFERYTFQPRLFFYPDEKNKIQIGINAVAENRLGGDMKYIDGLRDTAYPYFEQNRSQRISAQLSWIRMLHDDCFFTFKTSVNSFARNTQTPDYTFDAQQLASYTEASYTHRHDETEWIYGVNLVTDRLQHQPGVSDVGLDYSQTTLGGFIQNNLRLSDKLRIESGLRGDWIKNYGGVLLPRLSLLFQLNRKWTSRIGGGLGYKVPNLFTEETERILYRNLLPVTPDRNKLERSAGFNADINGSITLGDVSLSINQMFFYTRINNPLLLAYNNTTQKFQLKNIPGHLATRGLETNLKFTYNDFKWFLGYTFTDILITENKVDRDNFLTPRHRINSVWMYEVEEKWKLGLEAYYFDRQLLSDGTTGHSYWNCGFMAEKLWERFSVFINFENFLDSRQTRFDSIFTGSRTNPQFRDVYAPLEGFVINGGLKIKF